MLANIFVHCMDASRVHARSVVAGASVSTREYAVNARIVEAGASVSTGDNAVYAKAI